MKQEAVPFQIVILILSLKNIVTLKSALGVTHQGRSQKFAKRGGAKQEVWGTEVPQRGPGAEHRWGPWGEDPRSWRYILNA